MAKVFFICLSLLVVFTLLYNADCDERKDYKKKWKKYEDRSYKTQLSNELQTNNIADENESKAEWYEKVDRKLQRSQNREAYRENYGPRRKRDEYHVVMAPNFNVPHETPDPPPHNKVAEVARFIVHNSAWTTGGYISHHPGKDGFPMATLMSVSDGFANSSTGTPYMYISPLDIAVQDLQKDNRLSLLMSLAQTDYCARKDFDPEDPRCAYVILSGKLKEIKNGTDEWNFASNVYFDRHPGMRDVPADHRFRFVRFKIRDIAVQDYFGGIKFPSVKDYYNAKINDTTGETLSWN